MVKEPQRSSGVVAGPSNSLSNPTGQISFKERKKNFKSVHRKQGGVKKIPSSFVKLKKTNLQSPNVLQVLKKKRRRPLKDASDKSGRLSPRQKFAIFKPPAVSEPIVTMHPTQKEAEVKPYELESDQPILKIQVEKLAPENGMNGNSQQPEPLVQIENEPKVENNGHNHHDIIDHEEEIVDVVAVSEAEIPVIPEAEEAPVYDDIKNGVPEEPLLLSPRLRGSAKKGPSSSRSSSPADSLHKERTSRKLSYIQPIAEVLVEEKLEVSMVADLDEPLIVEGGAEDLEVSAALPVVEKSPVKARTPIKAASPSRSKKAPKLPTTTTPIEEMTGRRSRKPRSDEKKPPLEDASPRASMSMMEDLDDHKPLSGRAGSEIRSVRARRPIRRSRNISALDSSLHNQSSPWDEEYKLLSPRGGSASLIDSSLVNGDQSPLSVSVAQKRKVSEDELDTKDAKKVKNESSHTSSFFSLVTSPICALKEKFRMGALSSSTPFHGVERKTVDTDASMMSAEENGAEEFAPDAKATSPPVVAPEIPAKSWCSLM